MPTQNWPSRFPAKATRPGPTVFSVLAASTPSSTTSPPGVVQPPLNPGQFGTSCATWSTMSNDQKWHFLSGMMTAARDGTEQAAQNQVIADHIARIDLYCRQASNMGPLAALTGLGAVRPAGQATNVSDTTPTVTPPATAGMSKAVIGILSFGGAAVGARALWFMKRPRANPDELPYGDPAYGSPSARTMRA